MALFHFTVVYRSSPFWFVLAFLFALNSIHESVHFGSLLRSHSVSVFLLPTNFGLHLSVSCFTILFFPFFLQSDLCFYSWQEKKRWGFYTPFFLLILQNSAILSLLAFGSQLSKRHRFREQKLGINKFGLGFSCRSGSDFLSWACCMFFFIFFFLQLFFPLFFNIITCIKN